jgi:GMP synthase (glutamine-hydrolysing)
MTKVTTKNENGPDFGSLFTE